MKNLFRPLLVFVLIVAFGCSNDDGPTGPGDVTGDEVNRILAEAGKVEPLADADDSISDITEEIEGDYRYVYETHDVVDNIESIAYLGLNDDVIWPGALIRGDQAHNFVYVPIMIERAPITISASLESSSGGDDLSIEVEQPALSSVRQGISDLLDTAVGENTHVPARVEFNYQQVYSESHMNLFVGADLSYAGSTFSTAFDWSENSTTNKIMAKYMQIYFTIDMDTPTTPGAVLAPGQTADDIAAAFPPNCCPMYVSSVSYGVLAVMCIETSFTATEMSLAMDYAYDGILDASVTSEYTAEEILEQSSISIVVYGGSAAGLQDLETGLDGFMNVVEASSEFTPQSPGVPLVYRFRNLVDNSLALITLTSQYTLVRPINMYPRVRVTAIDFYCEMADDEGAFNTVDMDRFRIRASAYNRLTENESGSPIVEESIVYYWSTSGEHDMDAGDTWTTTPPNSLDIVFNNNEYDFNISRLVLDGWARDWDGPFGSSENGYGELEIPGARLLENGGHHSFLIESSDFRFRANVLIEIVN